jgi:hypothetical protein
MEYAKLNLNDLNLAKSKIWKYEECFEVFKNLEDILSNLSFKGIYYGDYKFSNLVFDK